MDKIIVNEDEYIVLCNEELRKHPSYQEGMEIIGVPEGKSGPELSGYDWKGPGFMPGIVSEVVHKVNEKYEYSPSRK